MYGYSKQLFDLWALHVGVLPRLVGIKFFNVYGPNEYHKGEMRSVVAKAFEQIRADGKIRLFRSCRPEYADGEQRRDFLYVKDAVQVIYEFMKGNAAGGLYNLGSGQARTWNDLARGIFSALGMARRIEYIDMPESLRPKYQYHTEAEMSWRSKAKGCDCFQEPRRRRAGLCAELSGEGGPLSVKRVAAIDRRTSETQIALTLNLDGHQEISAVHTSIPFMDHMLELFAKHGRFDLKLNARGDTHIDDHHLVEDIGIALGEAVAQALREQKGHHPVRQFLPADG